MTDQEALEALKRGDPAGMEALVGAHQLPALKLAYHITGDKQSAEDVVAQANGTWQGRQHYLNVYRGAKGLRFQED